MEIPKYPELNRIALLYPNPRILLGEEIYWTEKRDGSQLRVSFDGELHIATHHQDDASAQFKQCFLDTEQSAKVIEFLKDTNGFPVSPNCDFNFGAIVFGELLVKGKSPARFETHEKHEFVVFDIYSQKDSRFLPYNNVYQQCYHYQLPIVKCWGMTQHETEESLYKTRDEILEIAKTEGREGTVLKNYHSQIFAKEKLDTPKIEHVKIESGLPKLPPLPDSEALGAVAKAHADLGESFADKRVAMPLIAKYISEEQDKHLCSKPANNLFSYYQKYLEGEVIKESE
jgi:hypothetical protein